MRPFRPRRHGAAFCLTIFAASCDSEFYRAEAVVEYRLVVGKLRRLKNFDYSMCGELFHDISGFCKPPFPKSASGPPAVGASLRIFRAGGSRQRSTVGHLRLQHFLAGAWCDLSVLLLDDLLRSEASIVPVAAYRSHRSFRRHGGEAGIACIAGCRKAHKSHVSHSSSSDGPS